ncbi:hypothetical protein [Thalassotalea sp. PLHSN55]|uniref:hypothetical protein n=1 Tax=Thalassotalea sp. PLHSN55 TaxID=3435888 RepID=UPI003F830A0F
MIYIKHLVRINCFLVLSGIFFLFGMLLASAKANVAPQSSTYQRQTPETVINGELSLTCTLPYDAIEFNANPIFNENEEGIIWFHRLANKLHITTKEMTLENESAFFLEKCEKKPEDLAELERHLRARKFLRDARVSLDEQQNVISIETWDNWSLLPTISFGRKGGESTYSLGIKERNLLGLGIDTEIETYSNVQRSGYRLVSNIPLFQKKNTHLALRFADNDDGIQHAISLNKSFAGFHTKYAYRLGYNEEMRDDTIYQNGDEQSVFQHDMEHKELSYGWLVTNTKDYVLRYRAGFTQDQHLFSSISDYEEALPVTELPRDRDFLYPWFDVQYIEKDFKKKNNIHLISQIEDFNTGWQVHSRIGVGDGSNEDSAWLFWQSQIHKGFSLYQDDLLLMKVALAGDIYQQGNNRLLANISTEYFYQLSEKWGFYLHNANTFSENQYLDRPVTMGGNTGLRGFPLQYQHGKKSVKFSSEIRYYPNINIYKLFDLAGTVFADAGRAFGGSIAENTDSGWLHSFGVGARIYSPHAGGNNHVIHIDFAFPQSSDPDIDSFEIRVEAKHAF